jgi:integrase
VVGGRLPRRYEHDERRFLTTQQLARLVAEIPPQSRPLFELPASTGLRISDAIGVRVMDAELDTDAPCVHVRRARFHTLRHTCAAMLIDAGASPLRLQRWMGHHSAAFTLDTYGHLLGDDLGPHLDLGFEVR